MKISQTLKSLLHDRRGATAIEYSLICALMIIGIMVTAQGVANETNTMWIKIASTIQQATTS